MKSGIRAIGIDDGPQEKETLVVGIVARPGRLESVLSTRVELDGNDATEKMLQMVSKSRQASQIRAVFVNGVAVAGFNLIDYPRVSAKTGLPVIVVTENRPNPEEFGRAVSRWPEKAMVWKHLNRPVCSVRTEKGTVWFQFAGTDESTARDLILLFSKHSKLPEPVRLAHIIAAGLVLGESKGS